MYCTSPTLKPATAQLLDVPLADRWRICYRLQDLQLPCGCTEAGELWVEIRTPLEALLVRSTVASFLTSRSCLVSWLNRCWALEQ